SCIPKLQHRIGPASSGNMEILARGLRANGAGMGMAGKRPLGVALLRRNRSRNSQLQQICQARMDAAETRAATFGYGSARRSGTARAGRFPISNRVDTTLCRNLSGFVLGKQLMAR